MTTGSGFLFVDKLPDDMAAGAFVARIRGGIRTKQELLATVASELRFPAYFGENWDSLEECLRDLSWLPYHHKIVLFHEDLPLEAAPDDRSIYLDILRSAVESWGPSEPHELCVIFPDVCRSQIDTM